MPVGTIRYWAAARAAAGCSEEPYDADSLDVALAAAGQRHGATLSGILARSSFVVDDAPVGGRRHDTIALTDGGAIEVLPPFAGGSR